MQSLLRCHVNIESEERDVREQKEHARDCGRTRPCSLEHTERNAFSYQRQQITDPANLQCFHTTHVVDSKGIEKVSTQSDRCVYATQEKLFRGVES